MEGGHGDDGPPAGRAGEAAVESPKKDGLLLLADEKFDFDLSLSSLSANEDDEVFFGPVGHKERCIAASLELNNQSPGASPGASPFRWSPLTGEKFVEVYKEAHLLAFQLESRSRGKAARAAGPAEAGSQGGETFIQDSELKMSLFEKENKAQKSPNSLKRETYCLSDGPVRGPLPLAVQPAPGLGPQGAAAPADLSRTQGPPLSSRPPLPVEPSPDHPANQPAAQKKVVSKLLPPRASVRGKSVHLAKEKPVKEKAASPSRMKALPEEESHGDRPPGMPSAAQGATSAPACGSHLGQGMRSLPVPNKLALRKTALKPPGRTGHLLRKPGARGGVAGSSSSTSPAASTAKSSGRPSISADSCQPPLNPSQSRPAGATAAQPSPQVGPAPVSGQSQCPRRPETQAERPAAPATWALAQPQAAEPGGVGLRSQSRSSRSPQLSAAASSRRDSLLRSETKVLPASASQFKIPKFPTGEAPDSATPRSSRARRPQSCTSAGRAVVHGTPARHASGPAARTPVSAQHVAALPTPAGRRLSALPVLTPRTLPRTLAAPPCGSARRLSSEPRNRPSARTAPVSGCWDEPSDPSPPLAAVPRALSFSPEKSGFAFATSVTEAPALDEPQPAGHAAPAEALLLDLPLDELCIAPAAGGLPLVHAPLVDLPLIDLCSPPGAGAPPGPAGRPLIDLGVNTPDTDRSTAALPPHDVGQLIDLCSPLIQLSPEANKENVDSPLLKF
ncbi:G2 and S phase-expressed protein 1 [Pteronotus mesoamericanus]|uniref:G2 and S phase-expressed protein 1 n=1 Tax=Pteronotus mesoamericanus TaxID=1884717 RepID=UPI0023EB665D|nr:G2 and S phase-expressed protein 1 [Pteronotus parnellii mesoamericanus]